MSSIFVTSDHHFGSYKKLFSVFSKDEEDELVAKWNKVVKPNDIVLYNGDFSDGDENETREYAKKLNGQITLIKGNHDILSESFYKSIFAGVVDSLFMPELRLVVHHKPTDTIYNQVYGHLHRGEIVGPLDKEHCFCSCVQAHDGYPVLLDDVLNCFV